MEANRVSVLATALLALCATIATAKDLGRGNGVHEPAVAERVPAAYLPLYRERLPFGANEREPREPGEPFPDE